MKGEKLFLKNSKNQTLAGILFKPEHKKKFPIAIFCHGYKSTKESPKVKPLADKLNRNGIGLFAFDFSGRGESEGKFKNTTISQYIDDLRRCIDSISMHANNIAIIGNSLGGLVALRQTATDNRVKALVLLSPVSHFPWKKTDEFSDIKKWKKKGYAYTPSERFGKLKINYSFYENGKKYNNYSLYKNIKIPTLIVHGKKDEAVCVKDSEKLKKLIKNSRLLILGNADHNYTNNKDFYKIINITSKFIINNLK